MASVFKKGLKRQKESMFDQEAEQDQEVEDSDSSSSEEEIKQKRKLSKDELPKLSETNVR